MATRARASKRTSKTNQAVSPERMRELFTTMCRIRRFEEMATELFNAGIIKGPAHSYAGQEAIAAGTCANLTNLRELALREVARFLDQARRHSGLLPDVGRAAESAFHGRAAAEASEPQAEDAAMLSPLAEVDVDPVVMVAMSSRPPDVRSLLRRAAAIAYRLNTHWYLVYVETPRESRDQVDSTTQRILMNNIAAAKDLGAMVMRLKGTDVAQTLAIFAREYGITHAIFGSAGPPATAWRALVRHLHRNIASRFHALAPQVDLHVCGWTSP